MFHRIERERGRQKTGKGNRERCLEDSRRSIVARAPEGALFKRGVTRGSHKGEAESESEKWMKPGRKASCRHTRLPCRLCGFARTGLIHSNRSTGGVAHAQYRRFGADAAVLSKRATHLSLSVR